MSVGCLAFTNISTRLSIILVSMCVSRGPMMMIGIELLLFAMLCSVFSEVIIFDMTNIQEYRTSIGSRVAACGLLGLFVLLEIDQIISARRAEV